MNTVAKYQQVLTRAFASRTARNPNYSLRSFARDLELSASSLSLILKGKQGLSRRAAMRISARLGFNLKEESHFLDLVDSAHARSKQQREIAKIRLRQSQYESGVPPLDPDVFRVISDWYHFAILELTVVRGFKSDVKWIAKTLGLSTAVTKAAIDRLLRLNMLEQSRGQLKQTSEFLATTSDVPSDAIKNFHLQVLGKAQAALLSQSIEDREFSAMILPISRGDIAFAKAQIKKFRRDLTSQLEANPDKDSVYCLSVQFFNLQDQIQIYSKEK